jgi:hypothetical protein
MSTRPGTGLSTLVRPKFGPGMLLQHEDLDQLSTYTRDLNRLLFKSFFGCGVVCGLIVESEYSKSECGAFITVGSGLALNCTGDPIHVPKDQPKIPILERDPKKPTDPRYVILCSYKKCCSPRPSMCGSDDDEPTPSYTRDRDGFQIKVVVDKPGCACRCDPPSPLPKLKDDPCLCADPALKCHEDHYAGKCSCNCYECTGDGCDCVVLALLTYPGADDQPWKVDHSVRRFIRPVLMRDPQVDKEYHEAHP